jgi:hypothetical protein
MIVTALLGVTVWAAQAAEIDALIRHLGSPRFVEREAANRQLVAIGETAWPFLQKAARDTNDPEVRRRLNLILGPARKAAAEFVESLLDKIRREDFEGVNVPFESYTLREPMALPSGSFVTSATLERQAQPIIQLGRDAVPTLLKHVNATEKHVAYVVRYALVMITGLRAQYPNNRREPMETTIRRWREWYEGQTGVTGNRETKKESGLKKD